MYNIVKFSLILVILQMIFIKKCRSYYINISLFFIVIGSIGMIGSSSVALLYLKKKISNDKL